MNKDQAKAEVKLMKEQGATAYFANLSKPAPKKTSGDLPVNLSEAHSELEETRIALAEQAQTNAKLAVAIAVDKDAQRVKELLEAGKLTVPVANKLIALCEEKRAEQIVRLAEGDPTASAGTDQDINAIMEMLGELPATVATEAAPAPGTAPVVDPTNPAPADDGTGEDDKLDALARQIMQQEGCSYSDALLKAQASMAAPAAGAPAGGMN